LTPFLSYSLQPRRCPINRTMSDGLCRRSLKLKSRPPTSCTLVLYKSWSARRRRLYRRDGRRSCPSPRASFFITTNLRARPRGKGRRPCQRSQRSPTRSSLVLHRFRRFRTRPRRRSRAREREWRLSRRVRVDVLTPRSITPLLPLRRMELVGRGWKEQRHLVHQGGVVSEVTIVHGTASRSTR
jgi:hypothetical protein